MAKLEQTYTYDPDLPSGFEPVPAGWYSAVIQEADVKPTKDGGGAYIGLKLIIIGPSHEGRTVFDNITVKNANETAVQIGKQTVNAIQGALGLATLTDTDEMLQGEVDILVGIRKNDPTRNEVKGYRALGEGGNAPAPKMKRPTSAAPKAPPKAAKAAPPWAKKKPVVQDDTDEGDDE